MSNFGFDKYFTNKLLINRASAILIAIMVLTAIQVYNFAFATIDHEFTLRTNQQVYVPGEALEIFGKGLPNEILAVRLFDPGGLAVRIDNVMVDEEGSYRQALITWPEASRNFAFGTYTVEAISSVNVTDSRRAEVTFAGGLAQGIDPSRGHILEVKLDSPTQVALNSPFRIFVQVTFDGALVDALDKEAVTGILGSSHIHSSNTTIILSDRFTELHPGLYYADVQLEREDAYIIHAVGFYRGFLSHDSRVVTASASSIGTIQDSLNELNLGLESTNAGLDRLREGLDDTRAALNETKDTITHSSDEISAQIDLAQQASGQINSLILPLLALISVIIALQISLFARIRASYR